MASKTILIVLVATLLAPTSAQASARDGQMFATLINQASRENAALQPAINLEVVATRQAIATSCLDSLRQAGQYAKTSSDPSAGQVIADLQRAYTLAGFDPADNYLSPLRSNLITRGQALKSYGSRSRFGRLLSAGLAAFTLYDRQLRASYISLDEFCQGVEQWRDDQFDYQAQPKTIGRASYLYTNIILSKGRLKPVRKLANYLRRYQLAAASSERFSRGFIVSQPAFEGDDPVLVALGVID